MVWPIEKQRRCSIDWHALIPREAAVEQIAFERYSTAKAMRDAGLKFREIGAVFGVSVETARHYCAKAARKQRRGYSPAEKALAGEPQRLTVHQVGRMRSASRQIQTLVAQQKTRVKRDWIYV